MTHWNEPKLVPLSGAFDSEVKVPTGAKEGIAHAPASTFRTVYNITTS